MEQQNLEKLGKRILKLNEIWKDVLVFSIRNICSCTHCCRCDRKIAHVISQYRASKMFVIRTKKLRASSSPYILPKLQVSLHLIENIYTHFPVSSFKRCSFQIDEFGSHPICWLRTSSLSLQNDKNFKEFFDFIFVSVD